MTQGKRSLLQPIAALHSSNINSILIAGPSFEDSTAVHHAPTHPLLYLSPRRFADQNAASSWKASGQQPKTNIAQGQISQDAAVLELAEKPMNVLEKTQRLARSSARQPFPVFCCHAEKCLSPMTRQPDLLTEAELSL